MKLFIYLLSLFIFLLSFCPGFVLLSFDLLVVCFYFVLALWLTMWLSVQHVKKLNLLLLLLLLLLLT